MLSYTINAFVKTKQKKKEWPIYIKKLKKKLEIIVENEPKCATILRTLIGFDFCRNK